MIKSTLVLTALVGSAAGLAGFRAADTAVASGTAGVETAALEANEYKVDKVHTSVVFKIRHAGVSNFYGRFNDMEGTVTLGGEAGDQLGGVEMVIDAGSIDTDSAKRDKHLKGADFFNSRQFDSISFTSTGVAPNAMGAMTLVGDLTMYGTTKQVTATVHDFRQGSFRGTPIVGFEARFDIKRSDFGMTKYLADDESDDGMLGNTVSLIVAIEAGAS